MHSTLLAQRCLQPKSGKRFTAISSEFTGNYFIQIQSQLRRNLLITLSLILLSIGSLVAQSAVEWDKVVGRSFSIATNTSDGGIMLGTTNSFNYVIAKFNASGVKEWEKTFVGNNNDQLTDVIQTADGGYLLGGNSNSNAGLDKSEDAYWGQGNDFWIIKISANGTKQWDKTYGGTRNETLAAMKQTPDGGYILGGSSSSGISDVKTESSKDQENDYWVIKINASGTRQWDRTLGGTSSDELNSLELTASGGYILGGTSFSGISGNKTASLKGLTDYWVVQLSANGSKQWDKTYGGQQYDNLQSVIRTSDGGFLLGGQSQSPNGADKTEATAGGSDFWIIKVDSDGEKLWDKTLGGTEYETLRSINRTSDGGFLIAGYSDSGVSGNRKSARKGMMDFWIVKLTSTGAKSWDQAIGAGANSTNFLISALPAYDGGYYLCGTTDSYDAGSDKADAGSGTWIVKLLSESNKKKLFFSASTLEFVNTGSTTTPAQIVNLTASTGTPAVTLSKSLSPWLTLPTPALGANAFKVNVAGVYPGIFKGVVNATAPGYARALMTVNLQVNDVTTPPTLNRIGNKELLAGQILTFTATATAALGQTKTYTLRNAPQGAAIDTASGNFRWILPQIAGVYRFTVRVSSNTTPVLYDEETIAVTVLNPVDVADIRINAGGGGYTAADGRFFEADRYYGGVDRTSTIVEGDILNTTDDALYQSGRSSENFNYAIPVQNGTMKVTLHFAETFWGVYPGREGKAGQRLFNVNAEGGNKLASYDIFARAGGSLKAVKETFEVEVIDNMLNLDFRALADKARLCAIEVEFIKPLFTVAAVADSYVRYGVYGGTNYGKESRLNVKETGIVDQNRSTYIKFSLAEFRNITSAKVRLTGRNVEGGSSNVVIGVTGLENDNWTETGITGNNVPTGIETTLGKFDVANNQSNYTVDITEFAKSQLAGNKFLTIRLQDLSRRNRRVELFSRENLIDVPKLIITTTEPVGSAARLAGEETAAENSEGSNESSVIYPNPVRTQFTLQVGNQHQEAVSLQLVNEAGRIYPVKTNEVLHAGTKAEVNIADLALHEGVYLLKVQSVSRSEILKVLVIK